MFNDVSGLQESDGMAWSKGAERLVMNARCDLAPGRLIDGERISPLIS
jgi:hypothetical protein